MRNILFFSLICALLALFISSILMIYVRSTMHALFLLATIYLSTTALFMFLGNYMLAFIFLVTYLGAIIVLFIYVVILSYIQEIPLSEIKINNFFVLILCSLPFVETFTAYTGHISFILKKTTNEEYQKLTQIFQNAEWMDPERRITVAVLECKRSLFLDFLYHTPLNHRIFVNYFEFRRLRDAQIFSRFDQLLEELAGKDNNIYFFGQVINNNFPYIFNFELYIKFIIAKSCESFYFVDLFLLEVPHVILRAPKIILHEIVTRFIEYKIIQARVDAIYLSSNSDIVFYNWFNDKVYIISIERLAQFLYDHIALEILLVGLILLVVMFAVIGITAKQRRALKHQEIPVQVTRDQDIKPKS